MRPPRTYEAKAAARFIDTLPEETRRYLLDMIYRVAGVEPPPPPTERDIPSDKNVISLADVRSSA